MGELRVPTGLPKFQKGKVTTGGLWERMIRTVKEAMFAIIKD